MRQPRDQVLLDAIEAFEPATYTGEIWRAVHPGYDPLRPSRVGGRWDDGTFDVLYTSVTADGALAESWYHSTAGQPVPPSRKTSRQLFKVTTELSRVLTLTPTDLQTLGLDMSAYGRLSYVERKGEYPTTQQIGEIAYFYEYEALVVPNARWPGGNVVVITEHCRPSQFTIVSDQAVDLVTWHRSGATRPN